MTEIEFMEEIGEALRDISEKRGISQRELSRRTGINLSLINKYINAKAMPSFKNIHNICCELDCGLEDIVMQFDKVE